VSALSSAAAAIGSGFLTSLGQALTSWWALLPLTVALLMLGASLYLRRRTRITHLVHLPPAHEDTQPMDPGEVTADGASRFFERLPVIDGDELAKLRRSRRYEDDAFISDGITRALKQILKEGDER
jgi:hypothetical protein